MREANLRKMTQKEKLDNKEADKYAVVDVGFRTMLFWDAIAFDGDTEEEDIEK